MNLGGDLNFYGGPMNPNDAMTALQSLMEKKNDMTQLQDHLEISTSASALQRLHF